MSRNTPNNIHSSTSTMNARKRSPYHTAHTCGICYSMAYTETPESAVRAYELGDDNEHWHWRREENIQRAVGGAGKIVVVEHEKAMGKKQGQERRASKVKGFVYREQDFPALG